MNEMVCFSFRVPAFGHTVETIRLHRKMRFVLKYLFSSSRTFWNLYSLFLLWFFQSGEDEAPARIDEESDSPQDEQKKNVQQNVIFNIVSLNELLLMESICLISLFGQGDESNDSFEPPKIVSKPRHARVSKPIPIGMHHTVCGSEAINLAKRLTEELASQQMGQCGSLGSTPPNKTGSTENSPEELRSRSLEQGEKSKGNFLLCASSFPLLLF